MHQLLPPSSVATQRSLTCLVVAENRLYRELLMGWIASLEGAMVKVRGEAPAAAEDFWAGWLPDVLILEIGSSPQPRLSLAQAFLERQPEGRVIVLAANKTQFHPPEWLTGRLGAVIGQSASLPEFAVAMDLTLRNVRHDPRPRRVQRLRGRPLSLREMEVLRLIGDGLVSSQIAERLQVSLHTVATHRKRIASKLGTKGNQLTRWAILLREPQPGPAAYEESAI